MGKCPNLWHFLIIQECYTIIFTKVPSIPLVQQKWIIFTWYSGETNQVWFNTATRPTFYTRTTCKELDKMRNSLIWTISSLDLLLAGANLQHSQNINCATCFSQKWEWSSWQCDVNCNVDKSPYGRWNFVRFN